MRQYIVNLYQERSVPVGLDLSGEGLRSFLPMTMAGTWETKNGPGVFKAPGSGFGLSRGVANTLALAADILVFSKESFCFFLGLTSFASNALLSSSDGAARGFALSYSTTPSHQAGLPLAVMLSTISRKTSSPFHVPATGSNASKSFAAAILSRSSLCRALLLWPGADLKEAMQCFEFPKAFPKYFA